MNVPPPRRFLLSALVCLALGLPGAVRADPLRILWVVSHSPPMFSLENGRAPQRPEQLGQGELDGMLRLLTQRMPQYRHEFVVAEYPRLEALARQGEPVCSNLLLRTPERLSWLHFTHTHVPLQARQIHFVTRAELLPRLGLKPGAVVDLAALLARPDLKGLLERQRSYGKEVDALLQRRGQALLAQAMPRRGTNLLRMLSAGRMDFTLEYGVMVTAYNRNEEPPAPLVALPLSGAPPTTARATLACARNGQGRELIEAVDAAVRRLAVEKPREAWMRSWLGHAPEGSDRERLERYFDERARGGPQID